MGCGGSTPKDSNIIYRTHTESGEPLGLYANKPSPLTLTCKTALTSDVNLYRFSFAEPGMVSGLRVKSIVLLQAAIGEVGKGGVRAVVTRPYSPISRPCDKGFVELAIKTMPGGLMSTYISKLKVGDTIDGMGPILRMEYKVNEYKAIGMVAGGSGVTPMLQV
jgi:cytochrome-b5 reductase